MINVGKLTKDRRGYGMIESILVLGILLGVTFAAVDYWTVITQINRADTVKEYYLDRMRLEGILTETDEVDLKRKLENLNLEVVSVEAIPQESKGQSRKLRNNADEFEVVTLQVECLTINHPFMLGLIIDKNKEAPGRLTIKLEGSAISERVNE